MANGPMVSTASPPHTATTGSLARRRRDASIRPSVRRPTFPLSQFSTTRHGHGFPASLSPRPHRGTDTAAGGARPWDGGDGGGEDRSAAVRAEESVSGGVDVDVWSDAVSSHAPDHLLVMVHGILGSTADWQYTANEFVKQLPDDVIVHCSEKNTSMLTLDGVDVMGERLANEVLDVISRRPELTKISFLAHSVGGLAARYAIAKLYRHPDSVSDGNTKGTICGLEAINFITVATPHLGSQGNKQVPLLFGSVAMEKVACRVVHWIFRRTGRHLFLTDDDEGQPPLLQRMVEDHDDLYFISALRAFKRRVVYANADCDHIVGWRTSSIRRNTELPELPVSSSEKYPHIVHEEFSEEIDDDKCQDCMTECDMDVLEEKMVTGLRRVPWEKVDVSFHSSMTSFAAHSIIQVKYAFMNEGADVIQHIIDHFQLC
ncbi:unnamed protein product [Miscanthus lutarioriparius]|uniref:DUF676 domain-containing protein n=1 Tax=Miscanthus lutarioriparius TaxID=422564 RepID=A0A811PTT0_9POAL|nr:unnamed protein product [Miscanthus lutarioriparius]